ncbi:CBS domain-containing protein CBSX3, mitochondrial-like [Hibiscus syriacus]|uniref:CBS domain-containing protein CBSX3, mitochondrial-like n=1 Tax=Hibiscus syriacus TaxID=106335 RepID=UPI0019220A86|nr:CBS domain-containing protein CBSX3, mitochondrial-like [Hibiscus syriacus]
MQRAVQPFSVHGNTVKNAVLHCIRVVNPVMRPVMFSRCFESLKTATRTHCYYVHSNTTALDVLKAQGKAADGFWLWSTTDDTVYDAVKSITQHNVGSLMMVKPGEHKSIAGIITERDYLMKIIVHGRSSKSTKVGDIMTEEQQRAWTPALDAHIVKADKDYCCMRGKERKIVGVLFGCWGYS